MVYPVLAVDLPERYGNERTEKTKMSHSLMAYVHTRYQYMIIRCVECRIAPRVRALSAVDQQRSLTESERHQGA